MESFSANFDVVFNDITLTVYSKNIILWILEKMFKTANYDEKYYTFASDKLIHLSISNDLTCHITVEDQTFCFFTNNILHDYFSNNDFSLNLLKLFEGSTFSEFELNVIDQLLFDMSFVIDATKVDQIKTTGLLTKSDIKPITRLGTKIESDGYCMKVINAIRKNCLDVDPLTIFMKKASRYLEKTLINTESSAFDNEINNFQYLYQEYVTSYRTGVQRQAYTTKRLQKMDFFHFDLCTEISLPIIHEYFTESHAYNEFEIALRKYFDISDNKFISDKCINRIFNIYLNVDGWDKFCQTNKINQKIFGVKRRVVMFTPLEESPSIDFRATIAKIIKKRNEKYLEEFKNDTSIDSYNLISKIDLTNDDHITICHVIESNIRSFTIAEICDHWKTIHKTHVTLSGNKNTFSFSSALSD
jgi:hypothetical protein